MVHLRGGVMGGVMGGVICGVMGGVICGVMGGVMSDADVLGSNPFSIM